MTVSSIIVYKSLPNSLSLSFIYFFFFWKRPFSKRNVQVNEVIDFPLSYMHLFCYQENEALSNFLVIRWGGACFEDFRKVISWWLYGGGACFEEFRKVISWWLYGVWGVLKNLEKLFRGDCMVWGVCWRI